MRPTGLVILSLLLGCADSADSGPDKGLQGKWSPVHVVRTSPSEELAATVVAPNSRWSLTLPTAAKLKRALIRSGDRVSAGDPLLEVFAPELAKAATVERSAGALASALSARLEKLEKLGASGMSRASERTALRVELQRTRAEHRMAKALLEAATVSPAQRASLRERGTMTISSALAGTVVDSNATLGELREPHDAPWLSVVARAPIRIETRVMRPLAPFARATYIGANGGHVPLKTRTSSLSEGQTGATIYWFDPEGDAFGVHGSRGRVLLLRKELPSFRVARDAVQTDGQRVYVRARRAKKVHEVPVTVFTTDGSWAEVSGALESDDLVEVSVKDAK